MGKSNRAECSGGKLAAMAAPAGQRAYSIHSRRATATCCLNAPSDPGHCCRPPAGRKRTRASSRAASAQEPSAEGTEEEEDPDEEARQLAKRKKVRRVLATCWW